MVQNVIAAPAAVDMPQKIFTFGIIYCGIHQARHIFSRDVFRRSPVIRGP
jgi:hypothetical protein